MLNMLRDVCSNQRVKTIFGKNFKSQSWTFTHFLKLNCVSSSFEALDSDTYLIPRVQTGCELGATGGRRAADMPMSVQSLLRVPQILPERALGKGNENRAFEFFDITLNIRRFTYLSGSGNSSDLCSLTL